MDTPPDREAPADHPIEALLRRRWSPRSFLPHPVPQPALDSILEAGRWAASCTNAQPWHVVVTLRETPGFATLLGTLSPNNQGWAKQAGALLLMVAETHFPANGNPNRHAWFDCGAAAAQMALQAAALGLQMHQMAGFDPAAARAGFAIPDGYDPVAAIALGHVGPATALPEALAAREVAPRQRKPIAAFAFTGGWRA
jgi:nitroreductase